MRAKEFVVESRTGSLQDDVARALPATYAIPKLPNQDPYKQYRFGVAIAAAKGKSARKADGEESNFAPETPWGENEIIVSYDPHIDEWINDALQMVGLTPADKVMLSTRESEEGEGVDKVSPVKAFKGYKK